MTYSADLLQVLLIIPITSFIAKETPRSHIPLGCHVSLVYIHLKQCLRHSVCFKTRASNFVECISIWVCLRFPQESGLWQVSHIRDLMLSMRSIKSHIVLICPISAAVNFGHVVKVVFGRCVLYNGTTFPFVTLKYFVGR